MAMNGFASYDFDSSNESIKYILSSNESHIIKSNHKDSLSLFGGSYNGILVDKWEFVFKKNKLVEMKLLFEKNKDLNMMYLKSFNKNFVNSFGKHSLVEQNKNGLTYIWKFYFPYNKTSRSTYLTLNLSKEQSIIIHSGITK